MKRGWPIPLLALGSATMGQAQGEVIGRAIRTLQERGLVNRPVEDPLQPTGFPGLPEKHATLPEPLSEDLAFRIERAGRGGRRGDEIRITEGAEFWYRGYHVFADAAEGSLDTNIFTLIGNVKVIGKDTVVTGERVTINFNNETYLARNAESQIGPALIQGQVRDDLYVKARESYGSERQMWGRVAEITTCNLREPHYHIDAAATDVRPGRRMILRHAKVKLFGRTVASIPYISIPLDDRSYRYMPEFGQSEDEGYFVKTRYGIPLRGGNNFDSRVDYMTKLGTGLGGDYRYFNRSMNGLARIYTITGQSNAFTLTNDHRQDFRWGSLAINNDYQRNNYLTAPGSTTLNTRAVLTVPQRTGSTRLAFTRSGNSSAGGYETESESITIADQRRFGRSTNTSLDVSWRGNSTAFQSQAAQKREQIDVRFRGSHDLQKATANFEYLRTIPVGQTHGVFGGGDRTPFLALASDAQRLMGRRFADRLPFNTELSFGEFADSRPGGSTVSRYHFDWRFNRPDRSDHRFRLDTSGMFRQGMYSDDTAQYTNQANLNASYFVGRDTFLRVQYNYMRQHGFSPLSIDRMGRSNLVTTDLSYRPTEPLLLSLQSGYDFLRLEQKEISWQQVGFRAEYTPRESTLFRSFATYDTFSQQWSNVRLDLAYRHNDQFLALGARYDGIRKVWSGANLFVDNVKLGRTKLSAVLAYNGFSKRFDSQQYAFTYDLHCAELIMMYTETATGFRAGRDVQFFLRLKALPFDLPFGFGRRGQPLGNPGGYGF